MTRKYVAKVILSKAQKTILCELARRLDVSESEILRTTLMDYAKDMNLVAETVNREKPRPLEV